MLRKYWRKLLAPVIITVLLVLLLISYGLGGLFFWGAASLLGGFPWGLTVALCLLLLAGCGVSIYVLCERIKEIESGEEDDLSKY